MARLPRRKVPVAIALKVALRQLGFKKPELDHDPALGLREFNEATGKYTPDEHDPDYLVWREGAEGGDHRVKTHGTKATTAGSDVHLIAKGKRLAKSQEAFREMLLSKAGRALAFAVRAHGKRRWPSKKLPSRPFNTWRPTS